MIDAKKICLCIMVSAAVMILTDGFAQKTKAQLKRERKQNVRKIKDTEHILQETKKQRRNSLGEFNALNQRIQQQEKRIQFIQNEIALLNVDIDENLEIIYALERDLSLLKKEYGNMLFLTQKASNKTGMLMLLFSAKSFTQLWMRIKYMKQYSTTRQNQAEVIIRITKILNQEVERMQDIKQQKDTLLTSRIDENKRLIVLKGEKQNLIQTLEHDEHRLKKDLQKTQKAVAALDRLISDIIRKEMERAAAKNRLKKTKEEIVLSSSFAKNKSKFPWPVSGFISQRFGLQRHPILKSIQIQNDGINIQTRANTLVKAIFKGEVRAVAFIPSIGNSVIIGHGEYFTVYSGLKEVFVKKAQQITTAQTIGRVLTNAEGISELRFQIRKNTTPENPEKWLKK